MASKLARSSEDAQLLAEVHGWLHDRRERGTQVLTNLPWVLCVGKPGGLSRALLMLAGWVINLAVAERAFRTRSTKPTRTAMVPTDRGRDEAPRRDS